MLEIERKFLIQDYPVGLELIREATIEQGYLDTDPELRIHKATDLATGKSDFRLTAKGEGDLTRTELKTDINEVFYYDAIALLDLDMIQKDYKEYRLGQWVLEVSHVDPGTPNAFFYAEIEFPTEAEAKSFVPPEYLGREITYNEEYKMKNYWKRTRM